MSRQAAASALPRGQKNDSLAAFPEFPREMIGDGLADRSIPDNGPVMGGQGGHVGITGKGRGLLDGLQNRLQVTRLGMLLI